MAEDYVIEEPGDAPVVVFNLPESEDALAFEHAYRFFENRQHDHLDMAWDGSSRRDMVAANYLRERYYPRDFVPVDSGSPHMRKPDMTTPMAPTVTGSTASADVNRWVCATSTVVVNRCPSRS